jgi:FemAB-related protein (PEP-CTERM system-associated)
MDDQRESHCGFIRPLADSDEAELTTIPRKQRAEVRKSLAGELTVETGTGPADRDAHYGVYAQSVRNLGTPVFPRALFDAVLDLFGEDADILTIRHEGAPVASVLSVYHHGAVMPYWGGGTWDARRLRANDRMYYELMLHARRRGCTHFDFGRSKTNSGAYDFKRNWGFEPQPLSYGVWTAPGAPKRDADPTSATHSRRIDMWKKLPLPVANLIGPWIAGGWDEQRNPVPVPPHPFPPNRGTRSARTIFCGVWPGWRRCMSGALPMITPIWPKRLNWPRSRIPIGWCAGQSRWCWPEFRPSRSASRSA